MSVYYYLLYPEKKEYYSLGNGWYDFEGFSNSKIIYVDFQDELDRAQTWEPQFSRIAGHEIYEWWTERECKPKFEADTSADFPDIDEWEETGCIHNIEVPTKEGITGTVDKLASDLKELFGADAVSIYVVIKTGEIDDEDDDDEDWLDDDEISESSEYCWEHYAEIRPDARSVGYRKTFFNKT